MRKTAAAIFHMLPQPIKTTAKKILGFYWLLKRKKYQKQFGCLSDKIPVSIVIPSYNDFDYLVKCISGIRSTCFEQVEEIIIIDDYCDEVNSQKLLTLEDEVTRVILKSERLGFAGTVNIGLSEALHDVVLLNSDTVPLSSWLCNLQRCAYGDDPSIGIVSPMLIYPGGLIQYGGTFQANSIAPQWFAHLYGGQNPLKPEANLPFYIRGASGACMYIKKDLLKIIPGLDDKYWLGFEDVDYAYQAWEKGFRSFYEPRAALIHHESASRGYSQGVKELSSLRRFWSKWGNPLGSDTDIPISTIVFVHTSSISPLWMHHIEQIVLEINTSNRHIDAKIHKAESLLQDEVARLQDSTSRIVVCDWGAAKFGWLASTRFERAIVYCEKYNLEFIAKDTGIYSGSGGFFRPEFVYLPVSKQDDTLLRKLTPWESLEPVSPAFKASKNSMSSKSEVLLITNSLSQTQDEKQIIDVLGANGVSYEVISISEISTFKFRNDWPQVTLVTAKQLSPLESSFLLAQETVLLTVMSEVPVHILLDGYNCRTLKQFEKNVVMEEISTLLHNDQIRKEYLNNRCLSSDTLFQTNLSAVKSAALLRGVLA